MARPIPRLAPVTRATGLFGCGKFGVDSLGNIFHRKGLDKWASVDQNGGSMGNTARYAILVIFFNQCGQVCVAQGGYGFCRIYCVVLDELRETVIEIIHRDFAQARHGVLPIGETESRLSLFEKTRRDRGLASPSVFG